MNPGPFRMAQTGVPFGDPAMVRDFLGIDGPVGRPEPEHPKRAVLGFAQGRGEVSGARLWGWARERWGTPDRFFAGFFVANWCPLAFLDEGGRNVTPDKLPAPEREALREPCDRALRETVAALTPRLVVGVGAFAEKRACEALAGTGVAVGGILHPSPASPAANRGWAVQAERRLRALGVVIP
jgi:single-strand selective monofunctional uracil DNA glycosylase